MLQGDWFFHGSKSGENGTSSDSGNRDCTSDVVSVPVQQGSLFVFSNYQLAHRLMRSSAAGSGKIPASTCNCLAFYVVDQQHPLQSTANRPIGFEAEVEAKSLRKDPLDVSSDEEDTPAVVEK